MTATPARRAALDALRALRRGELLDRAFAGAVEAVPARERAWAQELVYGTIRLRGRLDHQLAAFVTRGLAALEPDVLDILRLGAYQLLEMGGVPPYAAVSQSVELAKAVGAGRGAGLVNGVLQSLRRSDGEVPFPSFEGDPVGYLATWGSHPRWLVERWVARFGAEEARALVEADNTRPELFVRAIGETAGAALTGLEAAGIEAARVSFAPDALRVAAPATALQALAAVPAVVQDPAASLVVRYADASPGAVVVDACAAPGGKALALAGRADYVAAADVSFERLGRVRENAGRIGALPLGLVVADARVPPFRPVDVVLVDAPCTGTGTLRRHPDGKWRLRPEDVASLVRLQAEILEAAAAVVAPGGVLVYATCSLEAEENEAQMEGFLAAHPEFETEASTAGLDPRMLDARGWLLVLPQRFGVDGAFAARLRRRD